MKPQQTGQKKTNWEDFIKDVWRHLSHNYLIPVSLQKNQPNIMVPCSFKDSGRYRSECYSGAYTDDHYNGRLLPTVQPPWDHKLKPNHTNIQQMSGYQYHICKSIRYPQDGPKLNEENIRQSSNQMKPYPGSSGLQITPTEFFACWVYPCNFIHNGR